MLKRRTLLLAAGALVLINCGSSTTAPSGAAPTTTSVTVVSSSGQVFLGASEVFTAIAVLSNGTQSPAVGGTWSTDAPAIAAVDSPTGRVSGATSGNANISIDYQGKRGTKGIRILPNYQGQWGGTYTVNSCVDTDQFLSTGFCASVFTAGSVLPLAFLFSQTNGSLSGLAALGSIVSSTGTSAISNDGSVVLTMNAALGTTTIVETWTLNIVQAGHLQGTVHVVVTDTTVPGSATIDATLGSTTPQTLARTIGSLPTPGSFDLRALAELLRTPWR